MKTFPCNNNNNNEIITIMIIKFKSKREVDGGRLLATYAHDRPVRGVAFQHGPVSLKSFFFFLGISLIMIFFSKTTKQQLQNSKKKKLKAMSGRPRHFISVSDQVMGDAPKVRLHKLPSQYDADAGEEQFEHEPVRTIVGW